jgi:hypothetical protein
VAGSAAYFVIQGLTLQASQANTGTQVYIGAGPAYLTVRDCVFGGNSFSAGYGIEYNASTRLQVERCLFNVRSGTLGAIAGSAGATGSRVRIRDCTVQGPGSFSGYFFDLRNTFRSSVNGCTFDASTNATAGSYYAIATVNGTTVTGNDFYGGSFVAALNVISGSTVIARDNTFVGVVSRYVVGATLSSGSYLELNGSDRASGSVAAYAVSDAVGLWELNSTGTVPTITMPAMLYAGQPLTTMIRCDNPASWASAVTYSGAASSNNVTVPAATAYTNVSTQHFVVQDTSAGGTYAWRLVGP